VPAPRRRSRDPEIAEAFGAKVKAERTTKGLTQEALAERTGLHPTFISNVERGYRVPTLPTLIRIARGLDVAPSTLIDDLVDLVPTQPR
jgi:transcriptional regulator with XRE-family HTH domain